MILGALSRANFINKCMNYGSREALNLVMKSLVELGHEWHLADFITNLPQLVILQIGDPPTILSLHYAFDYIFVVERRADEEILRRLPKDAAEVSLTGVALSSAGELMAVYDMADGELFIAYAGPREEVASIIKEIAGLEGATFNTMAPYPSSTKSC